MNPSKNLPTIIRYPLAIIAGILSGILFIGLTVGALKLGELIIGSFSSQI